MENGAVVAGLLSEMAEVLAQMDRHPESSRFRDQMAAAIQGVADTSTWLGEHLAGGDIQSALAGATPYLRQFGTVLGGWLMARAALAALAAPRDFDEEFLADKVNTARFYGEQLLPIAGGLVPAVEGGAGLLESAPF
jgi:hypothetical protein